MNRYIKKLMFIIVCLTILSACTTKRVEQVAVKKVHEEGYVILRDGTVFFYRW